MSTAETSTLMAVTSTAMTEEKTERVNARCRDQVQDLGKQRRYGEFVMPALVAGIHVFRLAASEATLALTDLSPPQP